MNDSSLFTMTCQYDIPGYSNEQYQIRIAEAIEKVGCCFGNQISMITQNPVSSNAIVVFPPCLLRFLEINYQNTISPSLYCDKYSNGNMTIFEFNLNITSTVTTTLPPVDVYNTLSILTLNGVILTALENVIGANSLPYETINPKQPLQVQIINYLYYSCTLAGKLQYIFTHPFHYSLYTIRSVHAVNYYQWIDT